MKITIATIGKAKADAASELFATYAKRLPWSVTVKELDEKKPLPTEARKEREAELLLEAARGADRIIALDERGKELSSAQFAGEIKKWQDQGCSHLAFLIGGQDGLHDSIRKAAHLTLCLGRMTWPHMLVRPLLAEQLYRAHTILTNHPYHRE